MSILLAQGQPTANTTLAYKVKMQYVQVSKIADTSIKHPIWGQSSPMVKGCMYICWIWYWIKSIDHLLKSSKVKESSLHVIWNAHMVFLLCGAELAYWWPHNKSWSACSLLAKKHPSLVLVSSKSIKWQPTYAFIHNFDLKSYSYSWWKLWCCRLPWLCLRMIVPNFRKKGVFSTLCSRT